MVGHKKHLCLSFRTSQFTEFAFLTAAGQIIDFPRERPVFYRFDDLHQFDPGRGQGILGTDGNDRCIDGIRDNAFRFQLLQSL